MAKRIKKAQTHYRCRVPELTIVSVKKEETLRFGLGMLIRTKELKALIAAGDCRADCFEPMEPAVEPAEAEE